MINAVIFDLDNTLYDYDIINERAIDFAGIWLCEETGIAHSEFQKAFSKGRMLAKKCAGDCASQHNRMIYFQRTLECLGWNSIQYSLELYEKYWKYMLDNMQLERGAGKLLKRLKESGIRTGICTDLTTHIQHRKLRKLQIADYVDVFVSSEEAGVEKPDIKIFNMVISKLKMKPDEVLCVGDSYEKDIIGASKAGMHPVWFNPHKKPKKDTIVEDVMEITEMEQLERYIYDGK